MNGGSSYYGRRFFVRLSLWFYATPTEIEPLSVNGVCPQADHAAQHQRDKENATDQDFEHTVGWGFHQRLGAMDGGTEPPAERRLPDDRTLHDPPGGHKPARQLQTSKNRSRVK